MNEIETRKRRWMDFYAMDGRTRFMLMAEYGKGGPAGPMLWYEKKRERVEWAYARWQAAMEESRHVQDDYVPNLSVMTGTEIFAEALGCRVHYPADNNPFAAACVHGAADAMALKAPRWQDTRLSILFDMADELVGRAGPGVPLHLPDIQSPLDIAALVWDKNTFYAALIEEPQAVQELIGKCRQLLTGFLDDWFARYGTAFVAHYPDYYMEGGVTLSEDEIGVISPAMFRTFALPTLTDMSARYGGIGVHCCADSERQWENMKLIPGLRLLNLNRPPKSNRESWDVFCGRTALWPSICGAGEDPLAWPGQWPQGSHAVLTIPAKNRLDAREKIHKLRDVIGNIE